MLSNAEVVCSDRLNTWTSEAFWPFLEPQGRTAAVEDAMKFENKKCQILLDLLHMCSSNSSYLVHEPVKLLKTPIGRFGGVEVRPSQRGLANEKKKVAVSSIALSSAVADRLGLITSQILSTDPEI